MSGDTLTILRARGRRLAKRVASDGGVQDYDDARRFDLHERPVANLDALAGLLRLLLPRPDCAVVRGAIADPARTRGVRRLAHPDIETGDAATLREEQRRWLALDLDGLPLPAGTDPQDLGACGNAARAALPSVFRGARCIVQASGSHGIKPGARLRLWYWCDRALGGPELARWLRTAPVNLALFRPAQLTYTAAPMFALGAADPLPERLVLLPGSAELRAPRPEALAPPPPRSIRASPRPTADGAGRYALTALSRATARVAAAPVNSRHATTVAEAWGQARLVKAGLLSEQDVKAALGWAIEQTGKTRDEAEAIVAWAVLHRPGAPLPEGLR